MTELHLDQPGVGCVRAHLLGLFHRGGSPHQPVVGGVADSRVEPTADQSRRRLERGNGRRAVVRGEAGDAGSADAGPDGPRPERFQRSTRKLSSSGQASSASTATGSTGSGSILGAGSTAGGGGSTGCRRERASRGRLRPSATGRSIRLEDADLADTDGRDGGRGLSQREEGSGGSRQSSSSSNNQSMRSPTQRPTASNREAPSKRSTLRRPGRAPDTPSTSWRPVSSHRSASIEGIRTAL